MTIQSDNTPRWIQTLGIILGIVVAGWGPIIVLFIWLNGQFTGIQGQLTSLSSEIAQVDTSLTARIDAVKSSLTSRIDSVESSLTARIDAVETKFDNKFDNLADMMIVAHTNGNVTEAELVEIWGRIKVP